MSIDVLAVAAHPDDAEIGCGGTLLALGAQGLTTGILDLTDGEPTPEGTHETRMKEAAAASKVLGLDFRQTLSLPNRYLMDTVQARIEVAEVLRQTRPRVILVHYTEDAHPDHAAASKIAEAARFYGKLTKTDWAGEPWLVPRIYYFNANHRRMQFPTSFVVDITGQTDRKTDAVLCYKSQFSHRRPEEQVRRFVEARAAHYGRLAHSDAGEPFFTYEPLRVGSFENGFLPARE